MTDYKIAPLTWLNNKYSQINHNHELYEEKELEQIIRTPYRSNENSYYDETLQEEIYYTVNTYINEYASSFDFSIENFNDMMGNDTFIALGFDNNINIIIKEMNNNEVWLYTIDKDGSLFDTVTLGDECNYWEVFDKEITISEPQTGISKNATIKINVNYNRVMFYIYENNILSDTITIYFGDYKFGGNFNCNVIGLNYTGFIIKNKIKYYEPKIISTRNSTSDTIYYSDLREFGKAVFNVSFNANEQNFVIDNLCDIYYNDGYIYDNDTRDSENNPMPIKQGNEIIIETILDGNYGGTIVNLTEGFIHRKDYYENTYYYGNYESLTVTRIFDEVGIRAKRWDIDNLNNNMNYKEDKSNKITQWSNSPSDTKYTSEKLVKNSLDGKQEKLVSGTNLRTLDGIDLLGKGDITIDVSCDEDSTTIFEDDCSSASGLSNYSSSECVRGSNATMTMEYDSIENAYKVYGSGNYHCYMPITALNGKTQYKLSADVKGQAIRYNMIGFYIDNCADTTSYGLGIGLDIGKEDGVNQSLWGKLYKVSIDGTGYKVDLTNNPLSTDKYYNLRLEVDNNSYTWSLYDGTTKIAENNVTYTIDNKKVGIFLYCETGTTNSACYIKNIKAKTLDNVIFKDKGVTGDYNSDYTDVQSGITTTVGATGTTLQASGSGDKFRKANALISGDFEAKYTCVSATTVYGSMRFMDSSNNNIFTVEQFGNNDNVVDINIGSTSSYPIGETITFPFTMTIRRVGTKLTVWYNDIQVATDVTVSDSDGYWAWKLYGNDRRQQTFKDFSIVEYNAGGSENTIYLGDDIMTMIDTALEHIVTNWEDYD